MRNHGKKRKRIGRCPSRKLCRSKLDAAQDLVKAANSRGSGTVLSLIKAAYWCPKCDFWHHTRQLPRFRAHDRTRHLLAPDARVPLPKFEGTHLAASATSNTRIVRFDNAGPSANHEFRHEREHSELGYTINMFLFPPGLWSHYRVYRIDNDVAFARFVGLGRA